MAIDGKVYKDGTPDYITSMVDAIIVGFPLKENKGSFTGIPSSKIVLGLPASYNGCIPGIGVGSGFVKYVDIEKAVQYIKGEISKPSGWNYTLTKSYPDIAGLMTWSINKDETNCEGNWMFSKTFLRAFPEVITSTSTYHSDSQFEVYPNPTTGLINVSNASNYGESIKIINSLGELMLETNSQDTEELSLEKLQPGIYFIKIGSQVERLILN